MAGNMRSHAAHGRPYRAAADEAFHDERRPGETMIARDRLQILSPADLAAIEAVPIEDRLGHDNTYEMFRAAAEAHADRLAIRFLPTGAVDEPTLDVTYAELIGKVHQTANLFHTLGIGPGKVVAYLLPNLPETYYCLWGGEAAGIVCAINYFLEAEHIGALLHHAKAEVLVIQGPSELPIWEKLPKIREIARDLKSIVRVGAGPSDADILDFHSAIAAQPADRLISGRTPKPEEIAAYFHTGGTTGVPKITPLSHRNETTMTWCSVQTFGFSERDIVYCGMPLFHGGGIKVGGMFAHASGSTVLLAGPAGFRNRRTIDEFWRAVEKYRVTYVPAPPTVYAGLMERPIDADLSAMEFMQVSAAPSPRELFPKFREATGHPLHEAYGLTEATLVTNINPRGIAPREGSAGFRLPYMEQRIVRLDDAGQVERECETDEIGVIAVKGPSVFKGYLPPASNDGLWLGDGWLNSGDMGRLDADGYLWITGRQKDMIIRSGHNIDPEAIEGPLYKHPDVSQCAAVGRPDLYAGEVPMVFVSLTDGARATVDDLMSFAQDNIPERAAIPKEVVRLESLPLTAVGKIAKNLLRDEAGRLAVEQAVSALPELTERPRVRIKRDPSLGTTICVSITPAASMSNLSALEDLLNRFVIRTEIEIVGPSDSAS